LHRLGEHHDTEHTALFYEDRDGFVDPISGFLSDGAANGDRLMVAVAHDKAAWLREALGRVADRIDFVDSAGLYERHGSMLTAIHSQLERHGRPGQGRIRLVAESALGARARADARAYMCYEAASNELYRDFDAAILCPYDAARLPDEILDAARRAHPRVAERGHAGPSRRFEDPRSFVRAFARAEPAPPGAEHHRLEHPDDLAGVRSIVRARAASAGLSAHAIEDLTIAVSEIAANAFIHGGAPRALCSYQQDGDLIVQIRDGGAGPADPLTGYLPPLGDRAGGRGLWLAHQLCDIVEITSYASQTDVFLHVRIAD